MNSSLCLSDETFGPGVEDCSRTFDFTLKFEDSILSIIPSILLILLAPVRLFFLKGRRRRVGGRAYQVSKLIAIGLFAVLQLALLISWSLANQRTATSIGSAALSFLDALIFTVLSYTEHSKSLRPSALLGVYLFFSLLFDAVKLRTLWLSGSAASILGLFTASLVMKFVILILEAREKRRFLNSSDRLRGPEETSGVFSLSVFWWLNRLIRQGFRGVLTLDDLYPIDEEMLSEKLGSDFRNKWKHTAVGSKYRLLIVFCKLFKWQMIGAVLPRLLLVIFTFCQPLLLNRFLEFLQTPGENVNIGYGLIGAYGVVYLGIAISTGFYWHRVYRWLTMIRGCLVSAIYHKTTEISVTELDNSAAVTLMSTDVERIILGLRAFHELWANLTQVGLATYLLQRELGLACIAPVIIAVLTGAATLSMASGAGKRQLKWVVAIQKRVGITSTMLSSMKGVKMSALTAKLSGLIQGLRIAELAAGNSFRKLMVTSAIIAFVPLQISPIVTFGTFIGIESAEGRTLDTTRMFTSISLLLLLAQPLSQIFQSVPSFMAAIGCFNRIQVFLVAESRADYRLLNIQASIGPVSRPANVQGRGSKVKIPDDLVELIEMKPSSKSTFDSLEFSSDVITVNNGSFGWDSDKPPILNDISFSVRQATFTIIIGPIASGKTTLLKALLGETPNSKGFIRMSTMDVSFCDQTPWLLSQSVQKNVLGFANFDAEWYNTVLHACALDQDIDGFPDGDQTLVGSNGITLSGGQKQRLAVARAVYAKKDIAIFDDVFSGLDATTEKHIFTQVFGPTGLLRKNNTTVIVATHSVNLLPSADQIIALGQQGQILEQGTFQQLNATDGYVHSFALQNAMKQEETPMEEPARKYKLAIKPASVLSTDLEDKSRQLSDLSVYKYYFKAVGGWNTLIFLFLQIGLALLDTLPSVWLKWWSDAISQNLHPSTAYYLGIYSLLQVGFLIFIYLLALHLFCTVAVKSGANLHQKILTTVMAAPMAFFNITDTGVTLNRFSQDIQLIDGELVQALLNAFATGLNCIGQAVLIATATFYIALTFPLLILVFYMVQRYYLRTSRQMRLLDLEAKSPLYTQFLESLSGLVSLRAFGWQEDNHTLNNELLDTSQKPFYLLFMIQRWLTLVMDLLGMGLALVVVGLAVKLRDSVSPGFTGVALVNIISFTESCKWLVIQWTQLETAIGAVSRIKTFEATTSNENLPNEIESPSDNWPSRGLVEFKAVSAAYKVESDNKALDELSFTIQPGEKIGICGRSGSGKSSTVLALFRMIEITSGSIFVDNVDISTLPRQLVRSSVNAIPQEAYFLHGDIRSNLDPWSHHSDQELLEALRKVQLLETIETKGGLDADLDVDMLSHGQRQLFCLARAILRPGNIVVLDEATSSVDRKTDEIMQRIIREEFVHHTIMAVAHRLETVLDFDRILVLEKGVLVEFDTPSNLLSRPSAFKTLYEMYEGKKDGEGVVSI